MTEFYGDALAVVNGLQRGLSTRVTLLPGRPWPVIGGVLGSLS